MHVERDVLSTTAIASYMVAAVSTLPALLVASHRYVLITTFNAPETLRA